MFHVKYLLILALINIKKRIKTILMKVLLSIALVCNSIFCFAQMSYKHNAVRSGDEIVKQQVEYKDPGRSGENVIWNFGQLKPIKKEYKLRYEAPKLQGDSIYVLGKDTVLSKSVKEGELVIGIEHKTRYYYQVKNNKLYVLGHENPTTLLHYKEPLQILTYPMDYQVGFSNSYSSEARYSNRIDIFSEGEVSVLADAHGKMILPSGDTLSNVIRIKTTQTFIESKEKDTISVDEKLNMLVDTYKWYVKGYRYPIFETIHTINKNEEGEDADYFKTAFFCPPQEHYYLWDDKENLAILDSLWNDQNEIKDPTLPSESINTGMGFSYNFYPNPVKSTLYIEYMLVEMSKVEVSLIDMNGLLIKEVTPKNQDSGLYSEVVDCSHLLEGNYILRLKVNENIVNEKILKK